MNEFIGILIIVLGVLWLYRTLRNLEDWTDVVGFTVNFKGLMGSVLTIILGVLVLIGFVDLLGLFD